MKTINAERAERFEQLLRVDETDDAVEDRLTDLLTDARHWCDLNGLSYAEHDRVALRHYLTEVAEERRP